MIAIIDYQTCNLGSLVNMLKRAGFVARGVETPDQLEGATHVILPGIGHFDTCVRNLREHGFEEPLHRLVIEQKTPLLGVCVGAQMLTNGSEEGNEPGLGWISGETRRFRLPEGSRLKVPHMGWNEVRPRRPHRIFNRLVETPRFYFVHSYYMAPESASAVLAETTYGDSFASAISHDNIAGVQFHPEKSHRFGMALLGAFAATEGANAA